MHTIKMQNHRKVCSKESRRGGLLQELSYTERIFKCPQYQSIMRKVIITLDTTSVSQYFPQHFFETLESVEGEALLRLDLEKGVKIGIVDIKTKAGVALEDIQLPHGWIILNILKEIDNTYTCLIRIEYRGDRLSILKLFDVDVIFDLPFILSEEKIAFSFVADNKNIRKLLDNIEMWGVIKNVSFQPVAFSEYNVLSCLTERQREVMTAAKKSGYYDVPRKISTEELAEKLGISTSTTVEHLRKAENRIISCILAGY